MNDITDEETFPLDKMTLEQACFEKQDGFCVNIFDGHVETISEDF